MNFWCAPSSIIDPNIGVVSRQAVLNALKSGDSSGLNFNDLNTYNKVKNYLADNSKGDWGYAKMYTSGVMEESLKFKNNYYNSPVWGPETPAWVQNGQDLTSKVNEYFIKAITTGKVDEEFNNWVNYFNSQGGKEATAEINDWYSKNKSIK
jgi:putative aldouronate transport system substrate-binding protein